MKKRMVTQIVYLPIDEIREYENNPRDNDGEPVEAVVESLKNYGWRRPLIIDKDKVLIAGHTRIKAARILGHKEVPCVLADDLSKAEANAYRLEDNRTQEDSQWDTEALAKEFETLRNNGFDLSKTGFDAFEIGGIDMSEAGFEAGTEDYDTPETESGEYVPDEEEPEDSEDTDEEYVVIIACKDEDEEKVVAETIGETGELKRRYTVAQIRKMLEGDSDGADAGV